MKFNQRIIQEVSRICIRHNFSLIQIQHPANIADRKKRSAVLKSALELMPMLTAEWLIDILQIKERQLKIICRY